MSVHAFLTICEPPHIKVGRVSGPPPRPRTPESFDALDIPAPEPLRSQPPDVGCYVGGKLAAGPNLSHRNAPCAINAVLDARPRSLGRAMLAWLVAALLTALAAPAVVAAETPAVPAPATTADGFAVPQPGHAFSFPRDHGSHPDFKLEWWYLTGHLYADGARRFGFQATFFRQAAPDRTTQFHLAHMAIVEVETGRFLHQERLNRAGWDAGAAVNTLAVHQGNWSLKLADPVASAGTEAMKLEGGVRAEAAFSLYLVPTKPLVVFGENGISRKGAAPTAASYYLTFSRLRAEGELKWGTETLAVRGEAWMDHEISSSQLDTNQVGWDWASLQLQDGRELMLYRLRTRDGGADPASSLTWVDAQGGLARQGFTWEVIDTWKSAATGATYPARVAISTIDPATSLPVRYMLEPLVKDQELAGKLGGIAYWEGACRVRDASGVEVGSAYLELTGYAADLKL